MVQKMAKRRQRSRAKRCLKESTLFTIGQRAGLKIFRRREVEEEDLLGILNAHREMVSKSPEKLIKDSPKTIVSIVGESEANGRRVCVKQYRYGTVLDQLSNSLRRPRGKVSWVAGNALFGKGISLLKPLAYVEKRKLRILQKAFYVTESMDDNLEMDRYLVQRFEGHPKHDLRGFIRQFAEWIGSLHRAGIYHRDLKTCNILVREVSNGWEFSLVDLEDVVQGVTIGIEKILKNLVQINCSIPRSVSYGDRVRFMKGYFKANPVAVDDRALIARILVESRRRGIVYVSPTGVVVEEFE
jgi:serine/threonine protein kinase